MTQYFVTAWCDRPFYAQCEIEAITPQEALQKARTAIHDAPAEECDHGYPWDEWRVDTAESEGVFLHSDRAAVSSADLTPNQQRGSYAAEALKLAKHYEADDPSGVQDLLSDLMHLCHGQGYDFTEVLRVATDNFNAEVMDEEFEGRAA
jgi:hypothetical protein